MGWDLNELYQRVTSRSLTPDEEYVVKLADVIESLWFIYQNGVGSHAAAVAEDLQDSLSNLMIDGPENIKDGADQVFSLLMNGRHQI